MKNFKFKSLLVLLLALCTLLCACGGEGKDDGEDNSKVEADNGMANYSVTVVDGAGVPVTDGVVVKFMQGTTQAAMQKLDDKGVAVKELAKGDYTVELQFTDSADEYYYDKEGLSLSATTTQTTVVLLNKAAGEARSLFYAGKNYEAYNVKAGGTYLSLKAGVRNFYIFTPTVAGKYEFSVEAEGVTLGYYGAPHFVMDHNAEEPVDGKFVINIKESMIGKNGTGTSEYVFGLDSEKECDLVFKIARIGDADRTIEDEPWTIYEKTVELSPYTLPAGATLKDFNLKASGYSLVFNEADGFYHLDSADGALVYVRLVKDNKYIGSFSTIMENAGVAKYFYDENGKFVKKEGYNQCLEQYIEVADEVEGVYPLTKDLEYIIKQAGDNNGWFVSTDPGYIFDDDNGVPDTQINADISWLFMCCYAG